MNRKQIIGWLAVAVGIALLIAAVHSMREFTKNMEKTSAVKVFFTHNPLWNPLIRFFGGKPQEKLPKHNTQAMVTQSIGITLVVVGGVVVYVSRRKNKKS